MSKKIRSARIVKDTLLEVVLDGGKPVQVDVAPLMRKTRIKDFQFKHLSVRDGKISFPSTTMQISGDEIDRLLNPPPVKEKAVVKEKEKKKKPEEVPAASKDNGGKPADSFSQAFATNNDAATAMGSFTETPVNVVNEDENKTVKKPGETTSHPAGKKGGKKPVKEPGKAAVNKKKAVKKAIKKAVKKAVKKVAK